MAGKLMLQIESGDPFVPDQILGNIGFRYGTSDVTHPEDQIRSEILTSCVAEAHYVYRGHEYRNYYANMQWEPGTDDDVIAHYFDLLALNKANSDRFDEAMKHVNAGRIG